MELTLSSALFGSAAVAAAAAAQFHLTLFTTLLFLQRGLINRQIDLDNDLSDTRQEYQRRHQSKDLFDVHGEFFYSQRISLIMIPSN